MMDVLDEQMKFVTDWGTVGDRLFRTRKQRGLGPVDASEAIGCSVHTLQRLETGAWSPIAQQLRAMATVYVVSTDFLLFGDEARLVSALEADRDRWRTYALALRDLLEGAFVNASFSGVVIGLEERYDAIDATMPDLPPWPPATQSDTERSDATGAAP